MSQWRVIDLADFEGKLSYRRGGIVLTDLEGNEKGSLQLADVCTILIGHGVTIGRSVLQQLWRTETRSSCGGKNSNEVQRMW